MEHKKYKESVKSICCIGCEAYGTLSCCIIANMCPDLNVAIVDMDPCKIPVWNSKNIPSQEQGLEEILRKCLNKNLVFTTETEKAIKEADLIFLCLNESFSDKGPFKGMKIDKMEKAARLMSEVCVKNKIIVQKSTVPVGASQYLAYFLDQNKKENVRFQVVYNPDFCSAGEVIQDLANPDRLLLGSTTTPWGQQAVDVLFSIYSQWIPRNKILTANSNSSELGKLATNAFLAQKLSSLGALSLVCSEMNEVDVTEILRIYSEITENSKYLEPSFRFGGKSFHKGIGSVIILSRDLKMPEVCGYWQQVLDMNEFHTLRFKRQILSEFYETLFHKKIAILGFSFKKNVAEASNSPASALCKSLLNEGAKLAIYDPETEKKDIALELEISGCSGWEANLTIADDVYKATAKANALVFCTDWTQFKELDFSIIYKNMIKPAYIFDARKFLPHKMLIEMGFVVRTIGMKLTHPDSLKNTENRKEEGKKVNSDS